MNHLAIIMDGNGRWAEKRGLSRIEGHKAGAKAVLKAIEAAEKMNLKYLSLYAFSTENFKRPKSEILGIFDIIAVFLEEKLLPIIKEKGFKVRFIGELASLPESLLIVISRMNAVALNNKGMTIVFAIGYGGREETAKAFNLIMAERILNSDTRPVTYSEIQAKLYTACIPDPDIIVRYGGYKRLSNFMPLQSVYSELYFLDTLFPDFNALDLEAAEAIYDKTKRNFGDLPK